MPPADTGLIETEDASNWSWLMAKWDCPRPLLFF